MFILDQINILGNFDKGWYNPIHHELGVSIGPIMINQPFYEILVEENPDIETEANEDVKEQKETVEYISDLFPPISHSPESEDIPENMPQEDLEDNRSNDDPFENYRGVDWSYFDAEDEEIDQPSVDTNLQETASGCNTSSGAPVSSMWFIGPFLLMVRLRFARKKVSA